MIVCVCNAVSESEIRQCVGLGCTTLDELCAAVGVGSCCGSCRTMAQEVIESCRPAGPPPSHDPLLADA